MQQQQQQQHHNLPGPVPVLYIEESIKSARPEVDGKYYTDWRVYVIYRYGKYLFMGTRQPVTTNSNSNASWPVVSLSFNYPSELYHYISSLFGDSKANVTLYVSTAETSACIDDMFTNPSHAGLYHMDEERANRKMELVGYDRVRVPAQYFSARHPDRTNIVKQMLINLDCMCHAPSGMTLSFRCSVCPPLTMESNESNETNETNEPTEPIDNRVYLDPEIEGAVRYNNDYDYEYDCYD